MSDQATAAKDKIPVKEKLLYGFGNPAQALGASVGDRMSNQVLVMQVGIAPALVTLSVMIFRIFDGMIDPIMGWISDSFRSRWGRRRPFIFVGAILMACVFPFIYRFNPEWSDTSIIAWFIGFGILAAVVTTIYNIPYQSLKMEMTPDYHERTSINSYISAITKGFYFLLPWTWWLTQQPIFADLLPNGSPNTLQGVQNVSLLIAFIILLIGVVPALICKERYYKKAKGRKTEPILQSFRYTFQNGPFRILIVMILFFTLEGLVEGLGLYLNVYYVWDGQ